MLYSVLRRSRLEDCWRWVFICPLTLGKAPACAMDLLRFPLAKLLAQVQLALCQAFTPRWQCQSHSLLGLIHPSLPSPIPTPLPTLPLIGRSLPALLGSPWDGAGLPEGTVYVLGVATCVRSWCCNMKHPTLVHQSLHQRTRRIGLCHKAETKYRQWSVAIACPQAACNLWYTHARSNL